MTKYEQIATTIIKEQEQLMGSVAWQVASKVNGLHIINNETGGLSMDEGGDNRVVIDNLINKYGGLFGEAARRVCKEAVIALIADLAPSEVPSSLQ